jgi:hypothetical protein
MIFGEIMFDESITDEVINPPKYDRKEPKMKKVSNSREQLFQKDPTN